MQASRYKFFDVAKLKLRSLRHRSSKVFISDMLAVQQHPQVLDTPDVRALAAYMVAAKELGSPVIFFIGGHVIKSGLGLYLQQFINDGYVTLIAGNGAAALHDFELATQGMTSESVAEAIKDGSFGLWKENASLNVLAIVAARHKRGYGEAIGSWISSSADYSYASVLAAAHGVGVPFTVHTLIGGDINHMHAGRGDKIGQASYNDFLIFTEHVRCMQERGGVFVNIGSAVHGPEIYLKSVSMARNVLRQEGEPNALCVNGVLDMYPLPANWRDGEAGEDEPGYYFRPWKTILLRSLAEGSRSCYVQGNVKATLPALYHWIRKIEQDKENDDNPPTA